MRVLVTGGSGIVGHYVIDELVRTGYEVVNADKVRWGNLSHSGTAGAAQSTAFKMRESWPKLPTFFEVDVTNYGQVVSAMDGCEAVVHLAACPSASYYTEEFVFFTNTTSMWNVMRAAEQLKVRRVVLGSSYNSVGAMGTAARWAPHEVKPPEYFPLDDRVGTRSEDPYSVAKWLGEQTADAFARRNPETQYSSMRFNGMWDDNRFRELHRAPVTDPWVRCQGFWTYLHIKDAATACRMAIESSGWSGHEKLFLNADDTMVNVPTMEAIRTVYPGVPLRRQFDGFEAPISTERARKVIGWRPKHSWRDARFA
jgi:nucleoside-diphosphate-sugar epimerase